MKKRKTALPVYLSEIIRKQLADFSERNGLSMSAVVSLALADLFKKD